MRRPFTTSRGELVMMPSPGPRCRYRVASGALALAGSWGSALAAHASGPPACPVRALAGGLAVPLPGSFPGRAEHRADRGPRMALCAGDAHGVGKLALAVGEAPDCRRDVPQRPRVGDGLRVGLVLLEVAGELVAGPQYVLRRPRHQRAPSPRAGFWPGAAAGGQDPALRARPRPHPVYALSVTPPR